MLPTKFRCQSWIRETKPSLRSKLYSFTFFTPSLTTLFFSKKMCKISLLLSWLALLIKILQEWLKFDYVCTFFFSMHSLCFRALFFFLKRIQVAKSCLYSSTFLKLNFSQCFRRRRSDLDSRNLISMEELSVHLPWNLTSGFSVSKFCSSHLSPQMYVLEDV